MVNYLKVTDDHYQCRTSRPPGALKIAQPTAQKGNRNNIGKGSLDRPLNRYH